MMQQIIEDYQAHESIKTGDFITLFTVSIADCEDGAILLARPYRAEDGVPYGVALDSCNAGEMVRVGMVGSFPVNVDLDTYYWWKRD